MSLLSWCGFDFIGKTFGEESCLPEVGDPPNFQPSILVDGGITYISFLKKLLIPPYARIENVKKGCYTTVEPKPEKCEKKKEQICEKERKCKKRVKKKQAAMGESNFTPTGKPKTKPIPEETRTEAEIKAVEPKEPKPEPKEVSPPERPSKRSCRLDPKHRCSSACRSE